VSTVHLAGSTARRLYFDGQDWCLELESWQTIDRDVFAPISSLIRSTELILPALQDVLDGRELVPRAKVIMQDRSGARVSFAAREGQFTPEPYPEPTANATASSASQSLPPLVQRSLSDLREELDNLRTQVRELEVLIAKFEPRPFDTSNENALTDEENNIDAV
jgi:hypothetical protein